MPSSAHSLAVAAVTAMLSFRRLVAGSPAECTPELIDPFLDKAIQTAEKRDTMRFMLLGFPFKSGNKQKVFSDHPDMAERLSLRWLNSIAAEVSKVYDAGVQIVIGSDGSALNDTVFIPDSKVIGYNSEIETIIAEEGLHHLKFWDLRYQYPSCRTFDELRAVIPTLPGRDIESLHQEVLVDPVLMYYVNGVTRFMMEDFKVQLSGQGYSNGQIQRMARATAYTIISRGDGLRALYTEQFPDAIRLSVHPQPIGSDKIGITMTDTTQDLWLTPWHGVAAEKSDGSFGMFKLSQVADRIKSVVLDSARRPQYAVLAA